MGSQRDTTALNCATAYLDLISTWRDLLTNYIVLSNSLVWQLDQAALRSPLSTFSAEILPLYSII